MTLEELKERRDKLKETYYNILSAGQEFQTRTGRVKQADLEQVRQDLQAVEAQIASMEGQKDGMTDKILLELGDW